MFRHQVPIQTIFLLGKPRAGHARWRGTLTSTCSWPMLSTNCVSWKVAHDHMVIISEFRWSIYPLLNISILAWKLFNFSFELVLHEMFGLVLLRWIIVFSWVHAGLIRVHILVLKAILPHLQGLSWAVQRWWRLHPNTLIRAHGLILLLKRLDVSDFIVVLVLRLGASLVSWVSAAVS